MDFKCVTIYQPYAQLIVEGGRGWDEYKDVENRDWYCNHRGVLLIHASKNTQNLRYQEDEDEYESYRKEHPKLPLMDDLVLGAIVGAAEMVDCYRPGRKRGRWEHGKWCWKLVNPIAFDEPVKVKGAQAIWIPPAEAMEQVIPQLKKAGYAV